jgi:hypothetical protein
MVQVFACSEVAGIIAGDRLAAAATRRCRSGTGPPRPPARHGDVFENHDPIFVA